MLLLGIIGHPLEQSLSPVLHNWACAQGRISASYYCWPIEDHQLGTFMNAVRTLPIHGVSVTIPHKEKVMDLVDQLTPRAQDIGAVNTLFWQDEQLWGDNTDIEGFMAPLKADEHTPHTALILGAGGAGRAAVYGLVQEGWQVFVTARNFKQAEKLAQNFGGQSIPWEKRHDFRAHLLVNSTPLGMKGKHAQLSPWKENLDGINVIYDLVYNPKKTALVTQGLKEHKKIIWGLTMFIHQAQAQFLRWTGQKFPLVQAQNLVQQYLS